MLVASNIGCCGVVVIMVTLLDVASCNVCVVCSLCLPESQLRYVQSQKQQQQATWWILFGLEVVRSVTHFQVRVEMT